MFSIAVLVVFCLLAYRLAPREKASDAHVHGAGQIGLLAAVALFGVDYFTSYFYATGELMSALHPYGLQKYAYVGVAFIALANFAFGALYLYAIGVFNEGGGSYTASMRYLTPFLSLVAAVVLIEDYTLTIVVSALSGGDQMLSILNLYGRNWAWHFMLGAGLAFVTWYLTIRGRGDSSFVTFILLGVFAQLTVVMAVGLFTALGRGVSAAPVEVVQHPTVQQALYHMLTATMKGIVALSGLEAVSNGIQFFKNEDFALVRWGKEHAPRLKGLWNFYSGKSGIGRVVQTSFLFYGATTTLFLTYFSIHFNVFDGTFGRSLVGNLAFVGFTQVPGGTLLFWVYQLLAVALLAAASMTALQDAQATEWRDVAIGEIPEGVIYRDRRGTFTRSVTITFIAAVVIMLIVRGRTTVAVPFYGIGVFMPIAIMGFAVRKHILTHFTGRQRKWGAAAAGLAGSLSTFIFVSQIIGKWEEGGWIRLLSFTVLITTAHTLLLSPIGFRDPVQIHRIVREKARVRGGMASIVEWQSLKMQEYRYRLLIGLGRFWAVFGVRRPLPPVPVPAGDYDHALHVDDPTAPSILLPYLEPAAPLPAAETEQVR
jgi:hypothetical protein